MRRKRVAIWAIALALSVLAVAPTSASAQQAKLDSLEARIRELEARLDSLLAAIARGELGGRAAQGGAAELAALRAAAQRAAGEAQKDTAASRASRTRNLNILNPEISATGDIVGNFTAPAGGPDRVGAVPREFEFSLQAALDPLTRTKIFITREEDFEIAGFPESEAEEGGGDFEIEEGYAYWIGLPGGLGAKVGKFRQEIGLYNRWHTHALLEVERPLPTVAFLGEDGLIQTGLAVTLPSLSIGRTTQSATLEIAQGSNEALFNDSNQLSYMGRIQSFWDLSASTYLQFGVNGLYGQNDDESLETRLLSFDIAYRWTPAGRALYQDFSLKGEWYFVEKESSIGELTGNGGYLQANYRLNRRWIAGLRGDYLESLGNDPNFFQLVPSLSWWQSEWVRLRLQYNYVKPEGGDDNHTILLQTVWAVGPHKHETY